MENMEAAFRELEKDGQNNVDNLVKWMTYAKVLYVEQADDFKHAWQCLEAARAKNKTIVPLDKFQAALEEIAIHQRKSLKDLMTKLDRSGPDLMDKIQASQESALAAHADQVKK